MTPAWTAGQCSTCGGRDWPWHESAACAGLDATRQGAAEILATDDPLAHYNRPSRDVGGSWERGDDGVPGPGAGNWGGV